MRVVDLFCGCGGLSLGFQKAGFDVVAAYDKWEAALNVYRLNFDHPAQDLDLSNVQTSAILIDQLEPDMIIGGPPCQDFSSAGKRDEEGGRGDLTVHYAEIISRVRPKWFVMENVARITKTQKLIDAKAIFKKAGYGLSQHVLDASYCGVPQSRKRFFLIGKLREMDGFMTPFINSGLATKPMTMRDFFGDTLGLEYYYRHPRSYVRRGIFSIDEPSPTVRGVNRPMPEGYKIHANDPVKSKEGIRPLTTQERSWIQTFPRNYNFVGNKTDVEQMIGNAVPVNLAKFVGEAINKYIASPHQNRNMELDFDSWEVETVSHGVPASRWKTGIKINSIIFQSMEVRNKIWEEFKQAKANVICIRRYNSLQRQLNCIYQIFIAVCAAVGTFSSDNATTATTKTKLDWLA